MSLLGFAPLGRWALGQLPSNSNFVLQAGLGAVNLAGRAVALGTSVSTITAGFLEAGSSASFRVGELVNPGSFSLTGIAAISGVRQASLSNTFQFTGNASASTVRTVASSGASVLSGAAVPFLVSFASSPGAVSWAGGPVAFDRTHEAWVRQQFGPMSWHVGPTPPQPSWNEAAAAGGAWAAGGEPETSWTPASKEPEPWATE